MPYIQTNKIDNFESFTPPNPNNDITEGYEIGSLWYNAATHIYYICYNNTQNNAIWGVILTNHVYGDNLAQNFNLIEHFINNVDGTNLKIFNDNINGLIENIKSEPYHPGIRKLTLISDNTFDYTNTFIRLDDGITTINICLRIPELPVLADNCEFLIGLIDNPTLDPTIGIYWHYSYAKYNDNNIRCIFKYGETSLIQVLDLNNKDISDLWSNFEIQVNFNSLNLDNSAVYFRLSNPNVKPNIMASFTYKMLLNNDIRLPLTDLFSIGYGIQIDTTNTISMDIDSILLSKLSI